MKRERWKQIDGYDGRYYISTHGRVKSLISHYNGTNASEKTVSEKILKTRETKGYLRVSLTSAEGHTRSFFVHRIVISHFKSPMPKKGLVVNHIDGVKTNNHISNLEWVTRSENQKHAHRIGLQTPVDNGFKKRVQVFKSGKLYATFPSILETSRSLKIDRRQLMRAIASSKKKAKGFTFVV